MSDKTNFFDKAKKPIYIGDTVQHRLGAYGKSSGSGPRRYIVILEHNHVKLETVGNEANQVTIALTEQLAQQLVIIDRKIFR